MTIKTAHSCFVIAVFAFTLQAQESQPTTFEARREGSVLPAKAKKVTDLVEGRAVSAENGDTITVRSGQRMYQVKLQAIDAPDLGQPRFEDAKRALSKLIRGKDVRVVVHAMGSSGVVVGTVYSKGRDVGLTLLEKGLAWHYKRFPYQQSAASRKTYSDAESSASAARAGIWADASPTPPWEFRGDSNSPVQGAADPGPANRPSTRASDGRTYKLGPRGGCYYVSESGGKVYVQDKTLCGVAPPETKP